MKAYASQTGTRRNVEALQAAGWGFILSPLGEWKMPAGMSYMLDNGEWSRYQIAENQRLFKAGLAAPRATSVDPRYPEELELEEAIELRFTAMLDKLAAGADAIIVPDRVADPSSLERSLYWLEALASYGRPLLIPVQNGMSPEQLRPHLGTRTFDLANRLERQRGQRREVTIQIGIFLGGSTDWKEATMQQWGTLARELGCPFHVGRVNTHRRMRMALEAGATSIDGSCASRYSCKLPGLELARQGLEWNQAGQILIPGVKRPAAPANPAALTTKERPAGARAPSPRPGRPGPIPTPAPAQVTDHRQFSLF